jgi:hypothetical protein
MSNDAARPALSVMLIVPHAGAIRWYAKALGTRQLSTLVALRPQ